MSDTGLAGSFDCVVDASVLVKLLLPEEDTERASSLMETAGATAARTAPEFVYLECASVFWKRARRGEIGPEFARDSLEDLLALPLQVWPVSALAGQALALAADLDVSVYDASYLALAERLNVPLVTADAALYRKTVDRSVIQIRLLSAVSA